VRNKTWRVFILAVLLSVSAVTLVACTPADRELAWEVFWEWFGEKGKSAVTGSTGNPEVDAVLSAAKVLEDIDKADAHMDKAEEDEDIQEAQEAVALRPKDWTYRLRTATLMLKVNHVEYEEQFDAAENIVAQSQNKAQVKQFADEAINQLETVRSGFAYEGFNTTYQCEVLFQRLSQYYRLRWDQFGGSKFDWDQYERYKADAERCKQ